MPPKYTSQYFILEPYPSTCLGRTDLSSYVKVVEMHTWFSDLKRVINTISVMTFKKLRFHLPQAAAAKLAEESGRVRAREAEVSAAEARADLLLEKAAADVEQKAREVAALRSALEKDQAAFTYDTPLIPSYLQDPLIPKNEITILYFAF
jgi:hypothetical protein